MFDDIVYTWKHKIAFLKIEKALLGHNTLRGYLHDLDKIFMYLVMSHQAAHNIHVAHARHHHVKAHTQADYLEMVIDWECARYTKPDKPLNAFETLNKYYPQLRWEILPILERYGLNSPEHKHLI